VVFKKKVTDVAVPYLSLNLPNDSEFAVIREDEPVFRSALDDFWGGNNQADTYPLVVPLRRSGVKDSPQYSRQRLSRDWFLFVRDQLNKHHIQAVNIIFKVEAGWINGQDQIDPWDIEQLPEDELPKPEFIVSSGSVVRVLERNHIGVSIDTFNISDPAPPKDVTFENAGTRIIHFMAGHKGGYYVNITSGSTDNRSYDTYFPLIAPGEAWIHFKDKFCSNRVEFLPALPRVVTTNSALAVREYPSVLLDNVIEYLPPGKTITIHRYFPSPTGLWGEVVNGWIALQYLPYEGYSVAKYFTDWNVSGIPALRPSYSF